MKIKTKMLVFISAAVFIAFSSTCAYIAIKARTMSKNSAELLCEEMASNYGSMVQANFEVGMDAARTIAQTFEAIKLSNKFSREILDNIMKNVLKRNPDFLGVWTCWEPNALDNNDSLFSTLLVQTILGKKLPNIHNRKTSILRI